MLLVGLRSCWWPADAVGAPTELLVAIGTVGGPRFLCVSPVLWIMAACYALTDATAAAIAAHAAAAACAARRIFAARCWGATHAPRRMAAASRSTATAQREEECRGSANGHPGVRAGDTPLTRLARHAGYGGGRQCGERRCVQLCYAGRPSPHISQCCKYSTPLIPSRLPGRYVALPVILNGQYIP